MNYETKTKVVYKCFDKDKEIFDFIDYSLKSKCFDDSAKLSVSKMKDKKTNFSEE